MKAKKWLLALAAFAVMAVVCAVAAGAETYGDFEYDVLDDGTVEITDYNGSAKNVDIPKKIDGMRVTKIGVSAFEECTNLKSIKIPNSVTDIEQNAFFGCSNLTNVTIPDSVKTIGWFAFSHCTSLASITIPKTVTSIGWSAFGCCTSLTDITIPDSVTNIDDGVFYGCTSLTNIIIPDSVKKIGDSAFSGCVKLKNITLSNNVIEIESSAFEDCTSLTNIVIPDGVKKIGGYAFYGCTSLVSIKMPKSLTSIKDGTFDGCTKLTSITIPNKVTSIGENAFRECKSLKSIVIPNSVTEIDSFAFESCTNLTAITMSERVTYIGEGAFANCSRLKSITIPDSLTSISNQAFFFCLSLKCVIIPNSVISIGEGAFQHCPNLEYITIPGSVKKIGGYAFGYPIIGKSDFKVYCYSSTAGEKYAKDNGFDYVLLDKFALAKVTGAKLGGRAADALRINWTKNANADGYIVEMYQGGKWARVAKITKNSTTTYRKAGLKASTVYKFRVNAYKMCGTTAVYSAYSTTVTARTNPSVMTGAKLGGRAADALRVNWTKNASADGYIIEMYQGNKWVRAGKITNNSTTTFKKAGLKASTVYKFRVRAYKMSGSTALYGNYSATVTARTNPSIMKGVKIAGKAKDALRVNWTKNSSAQGYIVEMYKGGKWVRAAKITNNNTTTFRKAGLAKNTTYKFRVKAYYMSGKTALYGNYGSVSGKTLAK